MKWLEKTNMTKVYVTPRHECRNFWRFYLILHLVEVGVTELHPREAYLERIRPNIFDGAFFAKKVNGL